MSVSGSGKRTSQAPSIGGNVKCLLRGPQLIICKRAWLHFARTDVAASRGDGGQQHQQPPKEQSKLSLISSRGSILPPADPNRLRGPEKLMLDQAKASGILFPTMASPRDCSFVGSAIGKGSFMAHH